MPKLSEVSGGGAKPKTVKLSQIQGGGLVMPDGSQASFADYTKQREAEEKARPSYGMSRLEKGVVGGQRGVIELGQGAKQLGLNIGAKLGIVDDATAKQYNAQVADEARLYEQDLGRDPSAKFGRVLGAVAATAPAGLLGRSATAPMAATRVGIGQGAAFGALTPVTNGGANYFTDKAKQASTGAAVGGGIMLAGNTLLRTGVAAANLPRQLTNATLRPQEARTGVVERLASSGTPSGVRRGTATADATGINLSPGQRSGGKAVTMLENVARGSVWTRDAMFAGDQVRARQMLNTIRRTSRNITPNGVSAEAFATNLQGQVRTMTGDLASARSKFGREAYGAVDKAAGGQKIVQTKSTLDAIASVVDEYRGVQGADAQAIAAQAERFFNQLKGDGAIAPGLAMRQLQAWEQAARTGSGLFEGVQNRTTAKTAAGKLARALQDDLDNTANAAGGSVGEQLRAANAGWRDYSRQIDALEASALGRVVGEDFADDVAGVAFNKVSPEKVMQRMDGMTPSELTAVRTYITRANPELWAQYQRLTLERARDVARTSAPSQGGHTLGINPGAFVKALEGSSGQKAVDMQGRMRVLFQDSPMAGQVRSLMDAGRRMADSTGTNFSGTAGAAEAMAMPGLLGRITQGAQAAAGALGPLYGLRQVANAARGPAQAPMPMLQAPAWMSQLGRGMLPVGSSQGQGMLLNRPTERK